MAEILSLEDLNQYLFCPLSYYWERIATINEGNNKTTLDLPELAIRQAMDMVTKVENPDVRLVDLVRIVWEVWLDEFEIEDSVKMGLAGYHEVRYGQILSKFLSGKISAKGQKYTEPRATRKYKEIYRSSGLNNRSSSIDKKTLSKMGIIQGDIVEMRLGPYSFADAYSDSMIMAGNLSSILFGSVKGVNIPVQIGLSSDYVIEGIADIVVVNGNKATVYVLDFEPIFYLDFSWVAKRLNVIAATLMKSKNSSTEFPEVETVIFKQLLSGKEKSRKQLRPSRLANAYLMAARGIDAAVFTPAFLSGEFDRCKKCKRKTICLGKEDILESAFPGAEEIAMRLNRLEKKLTSEQKRTLNEIIRHCDGLTVFDIQHIINP